MRKITFLFLIISASLFAQKNEDYSKSNKEELINTILSKEKEITKINAILETEKLENKKKFSDAVGKSGEENVKLKKIIKKINTTFLRQTFDSKYINDKTYFKDADLTNEDDTEIFEKYNIVINSIMIDEIDNEVSKTCKYALDFNTNYLKLFEIRKLVLSEKYNEVKYKEAISNIEKLPFLEGDNNLDKTKTRITNLLKNYLENTCLLKIKLDSFRKADQSPVMKQKYSALEKDDHFKDYPYLIQVIKNIKSNVNNYNSEEDLQPCQEVKASVETTKQETTDLEKDKKTKETPIVEKKETSKVNGN